MTDRELILQVLDAVWVKESTFICIELEYAYLGGHIGSLGREERYQRIALASRFLGFLQAGENPWSDNHPKTPEGRAANKEHRVMAILMFIEVELGGL